MIEWIRRLFVRQPDARPPWESGPSDAERERDLRTQAVVDAYLAKPPVRRFYLRDHGPWDMARDVCIGCRRSRLELVAAEWMPPCEKVQ